MGGFVSSFFTNTGRTDDPDPVTGLTSRERYLVTSTWDIVRKNATENGVKLLLLFFEKYPDQIELFPFRDIPIKDLGANKRFQAHCSSVMYGVSIFIDKLDDPDLLIPILLKLGETHAPRNVTTDGFKYLQVTILELFGTFMTKNAIEAWEKTLNVAFAQVNKGLESKLQ